MMHKSLLKSFFLVSFSSFIIAIEPLIESLKITSHAINIVPNQLFKQKYLNHDYYVQYDADIDLTQLDESIAYIPFVMNVITIVWASGEKYSIKSFDRELFESLKVVKRVFQLAYPHTVFDGELIPERLVDNNYPKSTIAKDGREKKALLFSHGLDALCASFSHKDQKQLLITVHGNIDTYLKDNKNWYFIQKKVKQFAELYDHDYVFIHSNFFTLPNLRNCDALSPEISMWRYQAIQGLAWSGLAAPLVIAKGFSDLHLASSMGWDCPYRHAASQVIDDAIAFSGVQFHHDQYDLTRVQKCAYLAHMCETYDLEKPFVRVCPKNKNGLNCGRCIKCVQTMLGFMVAGKDYADYGFSTQQCDVEKMVKREVDHKKKITQYKAWHFLCIQEELIRKKAQGEPLTPFFEWFCTIDFTFYPPELNWRDIAQQLEKERK